MRSVCDEHFEADKPPAELRDHNDDYSTQDGDRRPAMSSDYDHGGISGACGLRAGIHAAEGGVYVRIRPRGPEYEVACSCGRLFGSESTGEKALDLLRDHVATVEACPCTCNEGTNPPRFIGERGD
jgi:hypothetical protein